MAKNQNNSANQATNSAQSAAPTQQTTSAETKGPIDLVDPDIIDRKRGRTLYEVGVWEMIWRNFVAGLSRGLGNLILFILFFLILGNLFLTYVWPYMQPVVDGLYSNSGFTRFVEEFENYQNTN